MKLNELTITEAGEGLRGKKFSSVELTKACLEQLKSVEPKINAFITVCENEALDKAKWADKQLASPAGGLNNYLLLGIPIAIKDNFCTHKVRTTAASKVLDDFIPPYDATVVHKLKEAGVVVIGKTNMDAWAHGSSTETSDYQTTRNPWNLNHLPGGSSGGSATATAADEVIASLGSETAGSIRQPSAWCGVVGLKPTYGRVSRYGLISMASSLDCPGPITKTIGDAAMLLSILAGYDPQDATSSQNPVPNYMEKLSNDIKGIRIGISEDYFEGVDTEVQNSVKQAIKHLEGQGAQIKQVKLFEPKYAIAVYTLIQRGEVSSNLARYDGIRFGNDRSYFGEEAKRRIMLGTYILSAGYYDQYYNKAQKVRSLIVEDFKRAFQEVDLVVGPTSPSLALPVGSSKDHPMFGEMADVLVEPSTIAGLPGVSIPCGFSKQGLPIGMQIFGPQFSEEKILNLAYQYEQTTQWHTRKPKLP